MFGAGRPFKQSEQRQLPQVKVSIRHGNLAYANYPVCVGHYFGDAIISGAEADLDKCLGRALNKRLRLGVYPGGLNTHEIFLQHDKSARPNGAIIIGLGRVGELRPGVLAHSIWRALCAYALKISEWPDDRFGAEGTVRSAKVSFLLIGTGFGGLRIRDSIESIINAVKSANDRLLETHFNDNVIFDEIEILEIHLDEAIEAAKEMERILQDNVALQAHFNWQGNHVVEAGEGGLQGMRFEEMPNWWHRLEIVYEKKIQELRFISVTDRARAEESLVSGQMQLADQFIAEMISNTRNSQQIARTLFEMLIPNPLKELAPNYYDTVLILDTESARYPWELLDDRWGSAKPLAVEAGMLRQLKTRQFRAKPLCTSEKKAFVIGNPVIPVGPEGVIFPDLPAAAKEAELVAEILAGNGFDVNKALRDSRASGHSAQDILAGLHSDGYRILHLAGHGVHEFAMEEHFLGTENCRSCGQNLPQDSKQVSGMVIGNKIFLTPGDVEQMRWVPELVFINCCHLGNTNDHYPAEAKRYNELAANLGTQFINMGVKAVIAAGWAVNDAAARRFAEAFYQSMLSSGDTFGRAVHTARRAIYEEFPNVNTWGAYQCYGNPDFRLTVNEERVNTPQQQQSRRYYYARAEWLADLENLINRIRGNKGAEENNQQWQEKLETCSKRVPLTLRDNWQAQADVAVALATVYGELKEYDKAISYLDKASAAVTSSNVPINTLEQRVHYQIKRALQFHPIANAANAAKKDLIDAIHALETLNNIASTIQRFSLLGNAYKRLAWLQSSEAEITDAIKDKITGALEKMRDNYHNALGKGESIDAYFSMHWITANIVLSWFGKNEPSDASKNEGESADKPAVKPEPKHWNAIDEPERLLLKALEKDVLTSKERENIIKSYQSAAQHDVNRKDKAALCEYFEFLIFMSGQANKKDIQKALQAILRKLVNDNPVKKSPQND
jgi:CHAT domain-containing protein